MRLRDRIRSIASDRGMAARSTRVCRHQVVATHVKAWLAEAGAPPLGENPSELRPLQVVRKANLVTVASFAAVAAPLVRTWCVLQRPIEKHQRCGPIKMCQMPSCALLLEAAGIMDFREVDHADLLSLVCCARALATGHGRDTRPGYG